MFALFFILYAPLFLDTEVSILKQSQHQLQSELQRTQEQERDWQTQVWDI